MTVDASPRSSSPFLLFDLGGVLIENVGFERLDALLPRPLDTAALKERWLASPCVRAFELGLIEPHAFAIGFVDEFGLSCSPDAFIMEFAAWPRGFFSGALELLARLRRAHRIGFLTNSNALHWARFGGFEGLFDAALSSHRTGFIKPDAECFEHAIEACGVSAEHIVFFDDSLPNVIAARAVGLDARHVNGLTETLTALGTVRVDEDRLPTADPPDHDAA